MSIHIYRHIKTGSYICLYIYKDILKTGSFTVWGQVYTV